MIYILLNALPILAATIASLGFGACYHAALGRIGRQHRGLVVNRGPGFLLLAFAAQAWLAAILAGALILAPAKAGVWTMALGSAVVIWLGFVLPVVAVTLRYRNLPARLVALDCGHWLAVMLIQAVVMKTIGLVPPPV